MSLDNISVVPTLDFKQECHDELPEVTAPSISPARRAALEALEREFSDLLAPQL